MAHGQSFRFDQAAPTSHLRFPSISNPSARSTKLHTSNAAAHSLAAMTKNPFPVHDNRNPKYYERRAGYPLPDAAWYRNTDKQTGGHVPMTFSKENFAQGFNITCGDYYTVRDALVLLLRKDDFYLKDFHKDMDAKFDAWLIWEKLDQHILLRHPAASKWRHDMLWRFISSTSLWIERHKDALDDGNPPDKGWVWGPERLTPKNAPGHVQYQHMKIRVLKEVEQVRIVRVDSLLDGDERRRPDSPIDIDPDKLRLQHLMNILKMSDGFTDVKQVLWQDGEDEDLVVDKDIDLVTALSRFQLEGDGGFGGVDEITMWAREE
jgi:hypothetical protein